MTAVHVMIIDRVTSTFTTDRITQLRVITLEPSRPRHPDRVSTNCETATNTIIDRFSTDCVTRHVITTASPPTAFPRLCRHGRLITADITTFESASIKSS